MTQPLPDLVGLKDVAELLGESLGTVHAWRDRSNYAKIPPEDATVSGVPVWLKARWTAPDDPLPDLPYIVGVKEVAGMFRTSNQMVALWRRRGLEPPEPQATVGRLKVWTIPPWAEWAAQTQRRIYLPDDYQP